MNKYNVQITSQAEGQLQEIIYYISHKLKTPDAAKHLLDLLENSFMSLVQFPQRVPLTDIEPWRTNGIHRLPVKNFFVYFWIDNNNMTVQITAIIYAKRDQIRQLSQMDMK